MKMSAKALPERETPADARGFRRRRVALTLLGLGLGCAAAGWYVNHRAERVSAAEASGRIVEKAARRDGDLWYVDLSYEYAVDGKPYRRRETRIMRDENRARAEVARFGVGADVVVYFDPDRPRHAALERTLGRNRLLFWVGALWLTLGALWMAYDRGRST